MKANIRQKIRVTVPKSILWKILPMRAYWAAGEDPKGNFGDQLTPVLIKEIFSDNIRYSGIGASDLMAVGSILEGAEKLSQYTKPIIWGSGFIEDGPNWSGTPAIVKAVRGKLSLKRIEHMSQGKEIALGDPGILFPLIYPDYKNLNKIYKISVIPHFADKNIPVVQKISADKNIHIIDVLDSPKNVARQICQSEVVFSSSLHGLIFSDAFNVPNKWTPLGKDTVTGGDYKFRDYYSAYGVEPSPLELVDAIKNAENIKKEWRTPGNIEYLQKGLIEAFPLKPKKQYLS